MKKQKAKKKSSLDEAAFAKEAPKKPKVAWTPEPEDTPFDLPKSNKPKRKQKGKA